MRFGSKSPKVVRRPRKGLWGFWERVVSNRVNTNLR